MAGMDAIIPRIDIIKTEIANHWLTGQGCSDKTLFGVFKKNGFDVYDDYEKLMPVPGVEGVYDIIGLRPAGSAPSVTAVIAPAAEKSVFGSETAAVVATAADAVPSVEAAKPWSAHTANPTKGSLFNGLIKNVTIAEETDDWKVWDGA